MPRFVAELSTISRFIKIRFTTTGFAITKLYNSKEELIPPKYGRTKDDSSVKVKIKP